MHLKSAICLSCQSALIFINNSKNILWESFCFQIRSCDFFSTREHWVNCHVLRGQWMVSFKAKLMMNWYLLRPKQAQGSTYTRPSVLCTVMDGGEPRRRSHRDTLKLTTKQRQADSFNQAAEPKLLKVKHSRVCSETREATSVRSHLREKPAHHD